MAKIIYLELAKQDDLIYSSRFIVGAKRLQRSRHDTKKPINLDLVRAAKMVGAEAAVIEVKLP